MTPEQIVRKLREADTALSEGSIEEVCKQLEISEQTYPLGQRTRAAASHDSGQSPPGAA